MVGQSEVASFGEATASRVLERACARAGFEGSGAELLRLGENAIFRLAGDATVVRVGRSLEHWDDACKEVAVARWLAEREIAAVSALPLEQPLEVDGHPVTFWQYLDGRRGRPDDVRDLADVLRQVHDLPKPAEFVLPRENPLERVEARIARARVPEDDQAFLRSLLEELSSALRNLRFALDECVIHGDAHVQNLMVTAEGPQLIDFERVAWGQPEWDLAVTATEYVTAQFWTTDEYEAFVDSYGFDVMDWSGFPVLRRVQELKMTTWLMQNVDESADIRAEYENRMEAIRAGGPRGAWTPF